VCIGAASFDEVPALGRENDAAPAPAPAPFPGVQTITRVNFDAAYTGSCTIKEFKTVPCGSISTTLVLHRKVSLFLYRYLKHFLN
jgi:hypothetical protein